jgi:ubiquinone/menaquinone biosynthesis C-methylase UbiE
MPKIGGGTASLDLGCGIGRHVKFLDEFGLNPYGVDLSDTAVNMGKCWMKSIGKEELSQKLIVSSVVDLPFKDEYFDVCISCGVLDSMPRDIAKAGMREAYRVMKQEGLMYLDLIMDSNRGDVDEIVNCGYEKNTIQSYFTIDSIKDFIGSEWEILEFKVITCQLEGEYECDKRAHLIIKKR